MNINTKGRLGALVIAGSLAFGGLLVASPATATTAPPTPTVTVDCSAVTITTPAPGNALQAAGVVQVSGGTAESLNVTLDVQSGTNSYQKPLPLGDVTSNTPFDITITGIAANTNASAALIVTWLVGGVEADPVFCRTSADIVITDAPKTPPVSNPPAKTPFGIGDDSSDSGAPLGNVVGLIALGAGVVAAGVYAIRRTRRSATQR